MFFDSALKSRCLKTVLCYVYFILIQYALALRRRQRLEDLTPRNSETRAAKPYKFTRRDFTRCPLVTSMHNKHYRFDVPLGSVSEEDKWEGHCFNGQCLAVDLHRREKNPRGGTLRIHEGRYWKITAEPKPGFFARFRSEVASENTTIDKSEKSKFTTGQLHFSLSDEVRGLEPIELRLMDMDYIMYIPTGEDLKEHLLIINETKKVQFDLSNGVYNSEEVIRAGFDAFARKEVQAWLARSKGGTNKVYKAKKGAAKGLVGGAAVAATGVASWALWNAWLAILAQSATMFSVLTVAFASVGALPIIAGGAVAGAIAGGAHGAHKAYKKERWYRKLSELSAPKKIFEKLRCMRAFRRCKNYHDGSTKAYVLVPTKKPCPNENTLDMLQIRKIRQGDAGTNAPLGRRLLSKDRASLVKGLAPRDMEESANAALQAVQRSAPAGARMFSQDEPDSVSDEPRRLARE